MARTRRTPKTTSASSAKATAASQLACPECGKTFARPAALGAHRRRAHGVAGASSRTRARRPTTRTSSRASATASRAPRNSNGASRGINRDALLASVFPNGLPAREAVIRAANDWLDQAEQLATMK